jgi:hypothetical protein
MFWGLPDPLVQKSGSGSVSESFLFLTEDNVPMGTGYVIRKKNTEKTVLRIRDPG